MAYQLGVKTIIRGARKMKFEQLLATEDRNTSDLLREAIDLLIKAKQNK